MELKNKNDALGTKSIQIVNNTIENLGIENLIENDTAILKITKEIKRYESSADSIIVQDEPSQKKCSELYSQLRLLEKELEDKRKEYVEPFNRIVKKANEKIKAITTMIGKIRFSLGNKLTQYQLKLEDIKRKEEEKYKKKIEKAIEENKPLPVAKTVNVQNKVETDTGKIVYKEVWRAELYDLKLFVSWCLSNNQTQSIEIKQSELNKMANFYKDTKEIPGIKINCEKQVATYLQR